MNRNRKLRKQMMSGLAVGMAAVMGAAPVYAATGEDAAVSKEETVYVNANADGSEDQITVSNWLKNAGTEKNLKDESELKDIKNVKGDEEFTQSGNERELREGLGEGPQLQSIPMREGEGLEGLAGIASGRRCRRGLPRRQLQTLRHPAGAGRHGGPVHRDAVDLAEAQQAHHRTQPRYGARKPPQATDARRAAGCRAKS